MFLKSRQRSAGVKAKCCCEVAELSYARFRALSQQHPDLIFTVATQMANRLVRTTQKVSDLAFLDITEQSRPHAHGAIKATGCSHPSSRYAD